MANVRHRMVLGIAVVLLGAALFAISSSYVVDRGWGKIAAAVVGGLAFPVLPGLWHLVGERRRKARLAAAKKPSPSTLTGGDRFWMRFVVVALVVLGPMFAASRFKVLGAVGRHGLWFVPDSPPDLSAIGNGARRDFKDQELLLRRIPGDAELVVVFHQAADAGKSAGNGVVAWGGKNALIAVDAALDDGKPRDEKLEELNADRGKVPWLTIDPFVVVPTVDQTIVVATDGWKSKVEPPSTGPSEELRGELSRAPQDAAFIAAFAPRTKLTAHDLDPATIRHGVVWAVMHDDSLEIAGRMELVDANVAAKLKSEIDDVLHFRTKDIPESCKEPVSKIVDAVQVQQDGTILTARAKLPNEALMGLMFCALK